MIPRAYVTAWRKQAPWTDDALVELDLVLSRALIEIYSEEGVSQKLAFRGGTALHKLFINPAGRFSEEIDLVQI
ncbi:MAG: nucleotidyl transferase AbiEii/AbiGii toxin family protein, partial [Deltaproteobacteria bacterium]|nr:nucleotidyl transferase AbiEii/AbiGii toxin family protein [Deltaproteobacteria bacterium]